MARIILFSNRKGCTGKSTLCIQLQVEFSTLNTPHRAAALQ